MTKEIIIDVVDCALNFTNEELTNLPRHENLIWVNAYEQHQYLFDDLKRSRRIDVEDLSRRVTTLLSLHVNIMRNRIVDSILSQNDNVGECDRHDLLSYVGTHTGAARVIYIDNYANWELNGLISKWADANNMVLVYPTSRPEQHLEDVVIKQRLVSYISQSDAEPLVS